MNAFALIRTRLPRIFTFEDLTPCVLARSKVLPDFDGFGLCSFSEISSLPLFISTFI